MEPLTDSTDLLGDGPALRARAAAEGYLFLPGLLPRDLIAGIRGDVLEILADAGWIRGDAPRDAAIADLANFHAGPEPEFLDVFYRQLSLRSINALAHHPAWSACSKPVRRRGLRSSAPHHAQHVSGTPGIPPRPPTRTILWCRAARSLRGLDPARRLPGGDGRLQPRARQPYRWLVRLRAGARHRPDGNRRPAGALGAPADPHGRCAAPPRHAGAPGVANRSRSIRLSVDYRYQRLADPVVDRA